MVKIPSINLQPTLDGIIDRLFLRFIPRSVTPNQVTVVRFILTPVVFWLLASGYLWMGLIVFIIAACTDFIDGTMARKRNQITDLGKVIDPVADKLLIVSVLLYVGMSFWIIRVFIVFILFETLAVLMGYVFTPVIGRPIGANIYGKLKLILQSVSVGLFILGMVINNDLLIYIAIYILITAFVFACLAGVEVARCKMKQIRSRHDIDRSRKAL